MKQLISVFFLYYLSVLNTLAAPKIILKLDDLKTVTSLGYSLTVMDYLKQKQIKASFGVIANGLDNKSLAILAPYLNATNNRGDALIELWCHGYNHSREADPSLVREFFGTSLDYQTSNFRKADSLVKVQLGIQMHTFGAPNNSNDSNSIKAIEKNTSYKVLFFSKVTPTYTAGLINLTQRVNMEINTGLPDSAFFVKNYLANRTKYSDYMVLQAHPPFFSAESYVQFTKCIDYLIKQGCEFVLPYDYYKCKTLEPK
jgi:peptidoglycan/xylan/chitin deacetylase (PgdA/CDA1 family)